MILVGGLLGMCPEKANRKLDKPGRYNDTKKIRYLSCGPMRNQQRSIPRQFIPRRGFSRRRARCGKARGKHGRRDRYTARPAMVGQGAGAMVKGLGSGRGRAGGLGHRAVGLFKPRQPEGRLVAGGPATQCPTSS